MSSNTNPEPSIEKGKEIDYTKIIPFASAGLILLGVSKQIFYYIFFGINILSYLDLEEIITLFLDNIVINLFWFTLAWVTFVELILPGLKSTNKKEIPKKVAITIVIGGIVLILATFTYFALTDRKFLIILPLMMVFTLFLYNFFYRFYKKSESKFIKDLCIITFMVLATEGMIFLNTVIEYRTLKNNHNDSGIRIVFNNEILLKDSTHVFISDTCNYYVGKTKNYVFVCHEKPKGLSVYPMSNILQIDFTGDRKRSLLNRIFD